MRSKILFNLLVILATRFTVTNDHNPSSVHSQSLSLHDLLYRLQLSESLSSLYTAFTLRVHLCLR